jgi:hypothetical protein
MVVRVACLCAWVAKGLLSIKRDWAIPPKKGKASFAPHKTSFVNNNGWFCTSSKQVGHKEHDCKNTKSHANVSLIRFDSCYLLTKGANGVKDKFVGTSMLGPKKAIWVPKILVTNLQGPKQVWIPKKN